MKVIKINYENHQDDDSYYTYMTQISYYTDIDYTDEELNSIFRNIRPDERDDNKYYPMYKEFNLDEFDKLLAEVKIYRLKEDLEFNYYLSDTE